MLRAVALLLVLGFSEAQARDVTFAWNNGPDWPAGTTVELAANGASAAGIVGEQHTLDVPVQPGEVVSAAARAVALDGRTSEWATLAATWPADPAGFWATKTGYEIPVMAAPTFVAEYPTTFNSGTSPKTMMNAVSVTAGEVIILVGANEATNFSNISFTENGSASLVSAQTIDLTDYTEVNVSSYTVTGNETLTLTQTNSGPGYYHGASAIRFSNSAGVGASNKNSGTSGSPSVSLTTTQANSAIVVICGDWNAVSGTQTFTNNGGAGSPTNLTDHPGDGAHYGVAIAYYPDAGAVGAKTLGMSAPSGQKWAIIAIEVKGTAGSQSILPILNSYRMRRN